VSKGARAVEQIGNLLNQAGVPPGISLDISQRLLTAMGLGKTSRGRGGPGSLDDYFSRSPDFYNRFRPPEQKRRNNATDQAGRDGIPGSGDENGSTYFYYGQGNNGKDGEGGKGGDGGRGGDATVGIGGGFVVPVFVEPQDLEPLWDAIRGLKNKKPPPDCCEELRRRIAQMGRRIREIEKKLKNTTEC